MSEPSHGVQDLYEAEPTLVWYLRKAKIDHEVERAKANLVRALKQQREHFEQTGSLPNVFARIFFTLADMVHAPVWCIDEMDIRMAMALRRRVKRANEHFKRCHRDQVVHYARCPADFDD